VQWLAPLPGEGTPCVMIRVAPAGPADVLALTELLEEMDRFYGAPGGRSRDERVRQTGEALFSDPAAAHVLLAWAGPRLAGMAAYSFLWPAAGRTRSLYLKELYVGEDHRRHGVGKRLMRAVFDVAGQHGCSRVEWTTDDGNTGAQAFYGKLGLPRHPSKVFYRVEDTGGGFPIRG
jgi:GNAT superfamily N-acetyltransferase